MFTILGFIFLFLICLALVVGGIFLLLFMHAWGICKDSDYIVPIIQVSLGLIGFWCLFSNAPFKIVVGGKMTKREAVIVSAYTGIMLGSSPDLHEYIEEILERPVFTHELASEFVVAKVKECAREDFMNLTVE